jgi:hypothetical protein
MLLLGIRLKPGGIPEDDDCASRSISLYALLGSAKRIVVTN